MENTPLISQSHARDLATRVPGAGRLEASEGQYRSLLENIPDMVWRGTVDDQVTFMSPQAKAICGYTAEELVAAPAAFWSSRIHPEDTDRIRRSMEALLANNEAFDEEYRWQRKDGQWIWIRSRARALVAADGTEYLEGTSSDVTGRKDLEDQVRQSQKMEAIGRLTGGIAHDFNNILAIILGNGRMLLDEMAKTDPRRADVTAILEAGDRAASLTRQLLMFSRRQVVRSTPLDLNGVVRGLDKMLRPVIGEDIELSVNLADNIGIVIADTGEIEQVIMNLVVNARDAMPNGGQLTIETAKVELDAEYASVRTGVVPGEYVKLSVTDTGCGIDDEAKRRIFEPFFTTKEQGKGTGLGLSTCYGIVQRCRGHITFHSELNHGTAFNVYLPRAGDSAEGEAIPLGASARVTGTETILLIEDDNQLRSTIHRALANYGYGVLDAGGSTEALTACEQHAGTIHLVLSDIVMPGMSGPETVALITDSRPVTRVLFMSGYSDHPLVQGGSAGAATNFIQKPFTPQTLAAKVREVLDS